MPLDETAAAIAASQARELIASYRRADYIVRLPRGGRARLRVGAPAPRAIATLLCEAEYAGFITAWNPYSQAVGRMENRMRQRELLSLLRTRCRLLLPGAGAGPGWREPSLCAIGIDLAALDALARQFRQNAVLVFDARTRVNLRIYRTDWREALPDDDADAHFAPLDSAGAAARAAMR